MEWLVVQRDRNWREVTTTVVYSDMASAATVAFSTKWATADGATAAARDGTYTFTDGASGKYVDIPGLPTNVNHDGVPVGPVNGVQGSFDGVSGTFTSASGNTALTVGVNVDGVPTWGGDLNFEPDSPTAGVMQDDDAFLNLGWWLEEAANGDLTVDVTAWATGPAYGQAKLAPLLGKATFTGIAVGKYTHKTINSIEGGHFNADAELVAAFGNNTDLGTLTGTISGFMQDGTPVGSGWKVELGAAAATTGDASTFDPNAGASIATNSVAIDDTADGALGTFGTQKTLGTWGAMFVGNSRNDEMPGGVVGQFHIGVASHPVNMVGAFAASNQEADEPD